MARIRMEMVHVAAIQDNKGKVRYTLPVTKVNRQNVECDKVTIWNTNKMVFRGPSGKMMSISI